MHFEMITLTAEWRTDWSVGGVSMERPFGGFQSGHQETVQLGEQKEETHLVLNGCLNTDNE